jgi:hypothetical protein
MSSSYNDIKAWVEQVALVIVGILSESGSFCCFLRRQQLAFFLFSVKIPLPTFFENNGKNEEEGLQRSVIFIGSVFKMMV